MKHLWIIAGLLVLALASCKSSNGPEPSEPAVMPAVPSEYTYAVVRPAFAGHSEVHLVERDSILSATSDVFGVLRISDSVDGFFTMISIENYRLLSSGDLRPPTAEPNCDSTALPIATHKSYDPTNGGVSTPTKKNGVVADGWIKWYTRFDEMESVQAAGETFRCFKVEKQITVVASSGDPRIPSDTTVITHIYWYSPKIQFFVKDQLILSDSLSFTRTLTSYKLGK